MPRKSRKKSQAESHVTEPTTVAAVLENSPIAQILASREAKAQVEPDHPMPEPDTDGSEAALAFERQRECEQAVPEPPKSHVELLGPRKRHPGEPATVYTSIRGGFKLLQDGPFRKFRFDKEPPREWKDKLEMAGFYYVPHEKVWSAAATWQTREASDKLALEFDGKDVSHGRGT